MTNLGRNLNNSRTSSSPSSTTIRSSSSTSTSIDTAPGVFFSEEDLKAIREAYVMSVGELNVMVASMLERFLRAGLEPLAVIHAIEETGMAMMPSPYYLRAILTRYVREGLHTLEDVLAAEAERDRRRYEAGEQRAQRWYGEERRPW